MHGEAEVTPCVDIAGKGPVQWHVGSLQRIPGAVAVMSVLTARDILQEAIRSKERLSCGLPAILTFGAGRTYRASRPGRGREEP